MSTTTNYNLPDVNYIRRALLAGILSHRFVQSAKVYYPGTKKLVEIMRGRLFGGPELIEPGLTLAVYPYHTAYDPVKGVLANNDDHKSVVYDNYNARRNSYETLGGFIDDGLHHADLKFVVQLYYQDPVYDQTSTMEVDYVDIEDIYFSAPHGDFFQCNDLLPPTAPRLQDRQPTKRVRKSKVPIQILPGEEVLTQWMDYIKYAIRDLKYLPPFSDLRNPTLALTDYCSSTWTAASSNLVFHTAYHVVCMETSEPPIPPPVLIPKVETITITQNV